MPRRSLPIIAALVVSMAITGAGCVTSAPPARELPVAASIVLPDVLHIRSAGRIVSVPLEDYVLGTALSEVSPVGESPETTAHIFRLQAILARTYAVSHLDRHRQEGFNLCDTTHCQLYEPGRLATSRFSSIARDAVIDTAGEILTFGQVPTQALFHSDCGGHTADAGAIWGGRQVPYLIGTPDAVPESTHRHWQFSLSRERLREAFNASPLSAVGRRLLSMRIVERDASGRASSIEIKGETVHVLRGEQVRSILNQTFGARAIRSTRFALTRSGDEYRFDGTGFGHGVGLCQVGAAARLRRGEPLTAILSSYFPGTRVVTFRPPTRS